MNQLEDLLKNVPDVYDDFVKGCLFLAKDFNVEKELQDFLTNNSEARTDETIEKIYELANVERVPLKIVK